MECGHKPSSLLLRHTEFRRVRFDAYRPLVRRLLRMQLTLRCCPGFADCSRGGYSKLQALGSSLKPCDLDLLFGAHFYRAPSLRQPPRQLSTYRLFRDGAGRLLKSSCGKPGNVGSAVHVLQNIEPHHMLVVLVDSEPGPQRWQVRFQVGSHPLPGSLCVAAQISSIALHVFSICLRGAGLGWSEPEGVRTLELASRFRSRRVMMEPG